MPHDIPWITQYASPSLNFHNPSGHTPEAGVATLPEAVFDRFAAHRGITLRI